MRGLGIIVVLSAGALCASGAARAAPASDPICADRPGKGSSTCTAPKSHWQFETGLANWSKTNSRDSRSTSLSLFDTAIKYGLTDSLHVEVDLSPFVRDTSNSASGRTRHSGFGDTVVKLKQELTPHGAKFAAAIVPHVKIPTAGRKIGNGRLEGGVIVPLSLSLGSSPWSLSASPTLNAALDADRKGYHPVMEQSLTLSLQATPALSLSAELWRSWDWDETTTRQASLDPSLSYKLSHDLQLDLGANLGLNDETADFEMSGGVSVRF